MIMDVNHLGLEGVALVRDYLGLVLPRDSRLKTNFYIVAIINT